MGQATRVPMTIDSSTAIWLMNPRNTRVMTTMISITSPASAIWEIWPKDFEVGSSPAIRLTSAPISDSPMTQMTVPATSGGKKRTSIENGLAMSRPNTPETSSAPYTAGSPYFWAMMIIGLSTVNVAPATTGSRTPRILPMPTLWISVATPDTRRSALTSSPMVDAGSRSVPPTMSGTATAPAYMMNRCCRPRMNSRWAGSTSSTGWMDGRSGAPGGGASVVLVSDMTAPGGLAP